MSASPLFRLALQVHLRIVVVDAGAGLSLSLAGLVQPLQRAAAMLPIGRLTLELITAADAAATAPADLALVVGPDQGAIPALPGAVQDLLRRSGAWGAVGGAVLGAARCGLFDGHRAALPWGLYPDAERCEQVILTPQLYELEGQVLSCCGGAASIDFALSLLAALFGSDLQARVKESLCIDKVREAGERQRVALQARFGGLQPKLSEAVALMEANIEEPLTTDDIASLVGISRRQLERQFKQYLGSVPSRYYLELRLQRARQLLLDSSHSIVQVGLMCGFSSGSHFSTAYRALFELTPREERQKRLAGTPPA